ncbi:MAG: response regulator transcription factor [Chloroflexota bacterium]|nr:response regulator transcription factor [Chloroflexota bacterium]
MSIRVVLADDHRIMRQGLSSLLEKEQDIEVVAEADNGRQAVELARTQRPDVIVMDLSMPDLNGVEATRQIVGDDLAVKVLALSMHSDRRFVAGVLGAGASGYLLKDCALDELIRAIRVVMAGQVYLSSGIAGTMVEGYVRRGVDDDSPLFNSLSAREREVLQLISEGKTTKETASALGVSVKTVETHRQQVMNKLNIHSVAELTKYAVREGLTSLEE